MNCSLLVLTRYGRNGPSSRVRHYNYVPALQRAGFDVTTAPLFSDEYIERLYGGRRLSVIELCKAYGRRLHQLVASRPYDLLWIEKELLPWLPAWLERALLATRTYVMDLDDPWHLRYAQQPYALVRYPLRHKLEHLAARAALVVVGNSTLAEWANRAGARKVIEVPSSVDLDRYPVLPLPEGPFTVGWIGTPPTEKYLALVAEPLHQLQASHAARVLAIGVADGFSMPGVKIERASWSENDEAADLARCHVGLAPLRNGEWERAKSGYKLVQYMAAGRATIASPVGTNASIVVHGRTGLLADTMEEWIDALRMLATDSNRLKSFGDNGRRRVEEKYSLQVASSKMIEALQEAASFVRRSACGSKPHG